MENAKTRTSESDLSFRKLFNQYDSKIEVISKSFSRDSGVPVEEYRSHLNEELWVSLELFDVSKGATLNTWLNTRFRQKAIDIMRGKNGSYYRKVELKESDMDAPTFEVADEFNVEDHVLQKRERDQRQLISFLTDPAKVDSVTTAIVTNFEKYKSITALAKALGLHHSVVKRKIERLAKNYDPSQFGDYRDYLAV
jgi:DNA-directed RNA polymerase specialized sigma24 family protein